jgi:hypothetical protein
MGQSASFSPRKVTLDALSMGVKLLRTEQINDLTRSLTVSEK